VAYDLVLSNHILDTLRALPSFFFQQTTIALGKLLTFNKKKPSRDLGNRQFLRSALFPGRCHFSIIEPIFRHFPPFALRTISLRQLHLVATRRQAKPSS
jgi:hypothetical protein